MTDFQKISQTTSGTLESDAWGIEGIFPYHDADGVHVYDIIRFAAQPVTRTDGPRTPEAPHRCGICGAVFALRGISPYGALAERGTNRHGEPYHQIVPVCPDCWREGGR